jgi:protein O-GlcNAc transferase
LSPSDDSSPAEAWRTAYENGRRWFARQNYSAAIDAFKSAIQLNHGAAEAYHDLGVTQHQIGRFGEALACFESAVAINGRVAANWFNGGNTLCRLGRLEEAVTWFQHAVQIMPSFAETHYNLANTLKALGRGSEAIAQYRRALDADPAIVEAHNNLGTLLLGKGLLKEALVCFEDAVKRKPGYVQAHYNAGLACNRLGALGRALEFTLKCRLLQPDHGESLALLVSLYQQACSWDDLERADGQLAQLTIRQLIKGQRPSESPFLSFTRSMDTRRNLAIARSWSQWIRQRQGSHKPVFDFSTYDRSTRRLTIGYLSEHFRNAATGHLIAGMFARHDRSKFKIHAYSWGKDDGSYYRRKMEMGVDRFVDIRDLSDAEAAARIYQDRVDILIDLMGWMQGHRMGILAYRPAPVQAHYLGYPGTTGADYIDYFLADNIVIPPEQQRDYAEKIINLPNCYQVTDCDTPVEGKTYRRSDFGLPQHAIVFCSFNTDYKIDRKTFGTWMRILLAVQESVLWLLVRSEEAKNNLRQAAAGQGIDPRRLIFASPLPKEKHLARLKLADLGLDTLTVNGHTTTSDALWSGVPVVTCQGDHFASRVASSILHAIALDELVTYSQSSYESLAVALANHPEQLRAIKRKLEKNRTGGCPLFNIEEFVRNLESAYLNMWDMHCD